MAAKGSYYEDYMRSMAALKHGGDRNAKQLLTDRNAYISFLEVQLERVSAACLSAQSFEQRLAEVEASQAASEQKISSLSKVFRLNQEYVEQTAEQSRAELAAFAGKMDSWMEKYSTELQSHEARLTESEEHLRRTDSFVEATSSELREDVDKLRTTVESDMQDLKTLVFTVETRLEAMQSAQGDTDQHMDILQRLVTDRLDEDLERIRTSLSEKCDTIEQKYEELRDNIKLFASEIETGWKADLVRSSRGEAEKSKRIQDQVDRLEQETLAEVHEVKSFLRKCLDAQHLLSTTVVGLQAELDDKRRAQLGFPNVSGAAEDVEQLVEDIADLRKNQLKLKDALRIIQSCSRECQQTNEAQYERLVGRLDSAEQHFAAIADSSLEKADDLRTKVVVALGDVEQKLRHDAEAAADNAIQVIRTESKLYFTQILDVVSGLEQRVEELEHSRSRIHVDLPRVHTAESDDMKSRSVSIPLDGNDSDITRITEAVAQRVEDQLFGLRETLRQDSSCLHDRYVAMQSQLDMLQNRWEKSTLRREEERVILSDQKPTATRKSRHESVVHRAYSSSSSSSACAIQRNSSTSKVPTRKRSMKPVGNQSVGHCRTDRLKELCLDLVAMEGSIKSTKRAQKKP